MGDWIPEDLDRIGAAEELQLASYRADGTLRPYVIMWVARAGDALYVRSAYGAEAKWYRRSIASGRGRIRAGGIEREVRFADASPADASAADASAAVHRDLDAAYHLKYDRYGQKIVGTVVGEHRYDVTIRLDPVAG